MRSKSWLLMLGVMLVIPTTPRLADARKKRVVVLPFRGPSSGAARRGVLMGLKR